MSAAPRMREQDVVFIGLRTTRPTPGVVVQEIALGQLEVVYQQKNGKVIGEDVVWQGDHWDFARSGPNGTYAMNSDRLRPYAETLRSYLTDPLHLHEVEKRQRERRDQAGEGSS